MQFIIPKSEVRKVNRGNLDDFVDEDDREDYGNFDSQTSSTVTYNDFHTAFSGSHNTKIQPVVELDNVYKHYGMGKYWRQVLIKLNMSVLPGEIYSLVGTLGSGKSTVLQIILGLETLDVGNVKVFGYNPRHRKAKVYGGYVGYMPQARALHSQLTIHETLTYYSKVMGLKREYFALRSQFLSELLALPTNKLHIRHLSEGQQLRVSFAIAVLHEPKLLILDEPTSKADSVFRHRIWLHLHNITTNHRTTVIIATHNIEEAQNSHKVGMLRNGTMLVEDNPSVLIDTLTVYNLQSAYYVLCLAEDEGKQRTQEFAFTPEQKEATKTFQANKLKSSTKIVEAEITPRLASVDLVLERQYYRYPKLYEILRAIEVRCHGLRMPSARRFRATLQKDVKILARNINLLLCTIFLPNMLILCFCLMVGTTPNTIAVAVVNLEAQASECEVLGGEKFSCHYLNTISTEMIYQIHYSDQEQARHAARRGQVMGLVVIEPNFTTSVKNRMADKGLGAVENGNIQIAVSLTDLQSTYIVIYTLMEAFEMMLESKRDFYGNNVDNAKSIIKFGEPIHGGKDTTYAHFIAPGMIVCFTFYLGVCMNAVTLIREHTTHRIQRSYVAGVAHFEIATSHTVMYLLLLLCHIAVLMALVALIIKLPPTEILAQGTVLLLVQGICGMAYGHVLSYTCQQETTVIKVILFSFYISMIFQGILWPLSAMPWPLRLVAHALPKANTIIEFRKLLFPGLRKQVNLLNGCLMATIWTVLLYMLSSMLYLYK